MIGCILDCSYCKQITRHNPELSGLMITDLAGIIGSVCYSANDMIITDNCNQLS